MADDPNAWSPPPRVVLGGLEPLIVPRQGLPHPPLPPYTPQSRRELMELKTVVYCWRLGHFTLLPNQLPEEQRTLQSTIDELHRGIDHLYRKPRHEAARQNMHELIDAMHARYRDGRTDEGNSISLEFEILVSQTRP